MNSANPPDGGEHKLPIVGGGTAGITVAARLRRAGLRDIALLEPSETHWYQPLWTLVGGGQAPLRAALRTEAEVMPPGVTLAAERATAVDPAAPYGHHRLRPGPLLRAAGPQPRPAAGLGRRARPRRGPRATAG